MSLTIYKYPIDSHTVSIKLPKYARILHVDMQIDGAYLWALVDKDAPTEERKIFLVGTGHPVDLRWTYISSFQNPPWVWHVFEDLSV